MAIELKRKQNESVNVFLRRFSDQVKRSGLINQFKNNRFRIKPKSKRLVKLSALQRIKESGRIDFLKKIGKMS
jgi:ribosomal protein S21